MEKLAHLIATLPVLTKQILSNLVVSSGIETLAQESMKLLISQCENYIESVMKCIDANDEFGSIEVMLRLLLGALDQVECDPIAMKHLKSAYPKCKNIIDILRRKEKCPDDIINTANQLMIMYNTIIH